MDDINNTIEDLKILQARVIRSTENERLRAIIPRLYRLLEGVKKE